MGAAWFKEWFGTDEYALLYGHRDQEEADTWAAAIITQLNLGRGARVLDMACGRGRHAKAFSDRGMAVHGIDLSSRSIMEARELVPQAMFEVHDMRKPLAIGGFELAVCLFSSIGYTEEPEDDRDSLRTAFTALGSMGWFVLDMMNSEKVQRDLVPEERIQRGTSEFHLQRAIEDGCIVKRITVRDRDKVSHFMERVRLYSAADLIAMAENVGFRSITLSEGPSQGPFDPERSDRCVLWARKPA